MLPCPNYYYYYYYYYTIILLPQSMGPGLHTWKFIILHKIQHSDRLRGGNKRLSYKTDFYIRSTNGWGLEWLTDQRLMVRHGMMQKSETNTKGGRALKPKPASSWSESSKLPVHFARPLRRWFRLNWPLCTHSKITCLLFTWQPQQQQFLISLDNNLSLC